jgi:Reverse transcriptase (RNA-dependent DNA polymerase)
MRDQAPRPMRPDAPPVLPIRPILIADEPLPSPQQLATHGRIMTTVPRHARRLFQNLALNFLNSYVTADKQKDEDGKLRACVLLLQLPSLTLPMPNGKFPGLKAIAKRMKAVRDAIRAARANAESNANFVIDDAARIEEVQQQQQADWKMTNVKTAVRQLRLGYLGKAHSALIREGMHDPNDPTVIEQLNELHPPYPHALPVCPRDAPSIIIGADTPENREKLRKILRKLDNGSAGGPSGFTGQHLWTLARDDDCLRGLALIMQDINNGTTGSRLREYITSATLYPLTKKGNGVRPIAVGEILKRAADKYLNSIVGPVIRDLCEPHQFGVGTPGGCERVIHATQAILDSPDKKQTALLVDVKNAFNTLSRAKILERVYAEEKLQVAWRNCDYSLGSPSTLRLPNGREIKSTNGVQQGGCLSSGLYAFAKRNGYKAAYDTHPDTLHLFAVLDDGTICGPAQDVIDSGIRLEQDHKDDGQEFNWAKCKFLAHPDNELPQPVADFLAARNVPIIRDATTLLGAPIGWDRRKMATMAMDIHLDSSLLFEQLKHPALPPQEAMLIMRNCTVPIPVYLSRVLPPAVLSDAAQAFDRDLLDAAQTKLELPQLTSSQTQQLNHKLIHAGFGLTSTAAISPIAYTCALASASSFLCNPDNNILPNGSLHPGSAFANDWSEALSATRLAVSADRTAAERLPPADLSGSQALDWLATTATKRGDNHAKLQHVLTHAADALRFKQFLAEADDVDKARLLSASGTSASAWLTAIPSDSTCRLSPRDYRIASRLRLGISAHDGPSATKCVCNHHNAQSDIHHGLSCIKVRRSFVNLRHDMVKNVIHVWARRLGCAAIKEPQNLDAGQERADNLICTPDGDMLMCDVAIVQPSCPSHIRRGQKRLGAANHAVREKHTQYDHMAIAEHAAFFALVAEVFGAPHPELLMFVKRLAKIARYDSSYGYSASEVSKGMMAAIGVAIQRGNAMILHRVRLMNRLAGNIPSLAQREARARHDAQHVALVNAAPAIQVHAPALADQDGDDDVFGGEGPAFSPYPNASARVPAVVRVPEDDGYVADIEMDADEIDRVLHEAQSQLAAQRRRVL